MRIATNRSSSLIEEPKHTYGIPRDPRIGKKYYSSKMGKSRESKITEAGAGVSHCQRVVDSHLAMRWSVRRSS